MDGVEEPLRKDRGFDVASHLAGLGQSGDDVAERVEDLLVCAVFVVVREPGDGVREGGEAFGGPAGRLVLPLLADDLRHVLERQGVLGGDRLEVAQAGVDLAGVPCAEDRFHVGEVLVERCAADTRPFGDAGHRHRQGTVLIDELSSRVEDGISHASKMTGLDGSFLRALYGPWATLVWISLAETMEEVDIATASLSGDGTYLERIDDAGPLFLPGSASQRLLRRLA